MAKNLKSSSAYMLCPRVYLIGTRCTRQLTSDHLSLEKNFSLFFVLVLYFIFKWRSMVIPLPPHDIIGDTQFTPRERLAFPVNDFFVCLPSSGMPFFSRMTLLIGSHPGIMFSSRLRIPVWVRKPDTQAFSGSFHRAKVFEICPGG